MHTSSNKQIFLHLTIQSQTNFLKNIYKYVLFPAFYKTKPFEKHLKMFSFVLHLTNAYICK